MAHSHLVRDGIVESTAIFSTDIAQMAFAEDEQFEIVIERADDFLGV